MSFVISDAISNVFSAPTAVPFAPAGTSTTATPISTSTTVGTQLGGVGTTYTLAPIAAGSTGNLVLSGTATVVNLSSGAVNASLIGGGSILEATVVSGTGSNKLVEISTDVAYNSAAVVNSAATLASGGTVSSAAGGLSPAISGAQLNPGFAFYAHTGAGNDQIEGSSVNDFIRGGAGNDTINGFGGNDVIRGGSGSDSIFGGVGNDTLYYTSDQLDGSTDTFSDFVTGTDKIAVQSTAVASTGNISGLGTNTITFTASGTRVVSPNSVINIADIQIV